MKYICDYCGKKFDTIEAAERCEAVHKKAEEEKAEYLAKRKARADEIKKKYRELENDIVQFDKDYPNDKFVLPYMLSATKPSYYFKW